MEDPNQKIYWIEIIQSQERTSMVYWMNYLRYPTKWNKLKLKDLRNFAKRLQSSNNSDVLKSELFFQKYVELNTDLGSKDKFGRTALHRAVLGRSESAEFLLNNSTKLKI